MAIVLPVMLLLLLGALDLGRLYYAQITISNAAKEAALVAASGTGTFVSNTSCNATSNSVMCAATKEAAGGFVAITKDRVVNVTTCPANASFGTTATVTVQAPFQFIVLFGAWSPTLSSTATAQCAVLPVSALNTSSSGKCTIPDLTTGGQVAKSQAASLWSAAGFTGGVTPVGSATDWPIVAQSPPVSDGSAACTSGVTIYQLATCTVPTIGKNWYFSDYQTAWTANGFTGALTNNVGAKKVNSVTPTPGTSTSCTSTGTVN